MNIKWAGWLAAPIVAIFLIFLILPGYLGMKAQKNLEAQSQLLAKSSFLEVQSHTYDKGWFSSTETTVVRLKPAFFGQFSGSLPAPLKVLLEEPIKLVGHVRHGPFADGLTPVAAVETVEFQYSPEAQKVLKQFFGDKAPVTMTNRMGFGGNSGVLHTVVADFNYQELSGIKIDWKGLSADIDYRNNFGVYDTQVKAPGLIITLADKGQAGFKNLSYTAHTDTDSSKLSLGQSQFHLDEASAAWSSALPYNLRVNELINMVTNLQIGAFINPNGSVAPNQVMINHLDFQTAMDEKEGFASARGALKFDTLHWGTDVYGPLQLNVEAEHLDSGSLYALKNKMYALAQQKLSDEARREAIIQAAKTEGLGLFTHDPIIRLSAFNLKTPTGLIDMKGVLQFNKLEAADMNSLNAMIAKTEANLHLNVPQTLLENLAQSQMQSLFAVDAQAAQQPDIQDIQNTAKTMVASTLANLAAQGYVKTEQGAVQSDIVIKNNQLWLNGKQYVAPAEPVDAEPVDEASPSGASGGDTSSLPKKPKSQAKRSASAAASEGARP